MLEELCTRVTPPAVMLERDDGFGAEFDLDAALDSLAVAVERGVARRPDA